jgi:hypothetical protein
MLEAAKEGKMLKQILACAGILALAPAAPLSAQDYYPMYGNQKLHRAQNVEALTARMLAVPGGEVADPYKALASAFGNMEFIGSAVAATPNSASVDRSSSGPAAAGGPAPLAPGSAEIP